MLGKTPNEVMDWVQQQVKRKLRGRLQQRRYQGITVGGFLSMPNLDPQFTVLVGCSYAQLPRGVQHHSDHLTFTYLESEAIVAVKHRHEIAQIIPFEIGDPEFPINIAEWIAGLRRPI
jgi:hypothetical protein